ncbi:hydrogenase 3 maturation endopeptidase HyCI [Thermococcus sp.]
MNLQEILRGAERIVICGIGNENRGDDAFGVVVTERLRKVLQKPNVTVINCGEVPESYTGVIKRHKPDAVIFIDAIEFGGKPGEIVVADPEGTLGTSASTHSLPLRVLVQYLKTELKGTRFILIGCQPKNTALFGEMSEEIKKSVEELVRILIDSLKD